MRRLRYSVAMSLDGFIAGPDGEYDWIEIDPDDAEWFFRDLHAQFDTAILGRKSFELFPHPVSGMQRTYVVSRSLPADAHPHVAVLGEDAVERIAELKQKSGKDLWLWGGGELFGSLVGAGLVDVVEVYVCPVILGAGVRLMSGHDGRVKLTLESVDRSLPGFVGLRYGVARAGASLR
jgi:dihydrofolate reductase